MVSECRTSADPWLWSSGLIKAKKTFQVGLSVREFALPAPRTGSIETHSGYGPLPQQGQQIHAELQGVRAASDGAYTAEYALVHSFSDQHLNVRVSGRADGFYAGDLPLFEEIKTAFDAPELVRRLRAQPTHPYWLQLLTYLYIHYKTTGVQAAGQLLVVSSRTRQETVLPVQLDVERYESWLALRLAEILAEEVVLQRRKKQRKARGKELAFPFAAPRSGQEDLMHLIEGAEPAHKHLLIEAPTGMGKTLAILLPTVRQALQAGAATIFITPKNSQHAAPEHAAKQIGMIRTLTLTAKARICMKAEMVCNPTACEYARDYYQKVAEHDLVAKLGRLQAVTAATLKRYAERYEVCPAELGMDATPAFDLIIGDYHYVIGAQGLITRVTARQRGKAAKPSLIIDEAHNLFTRATENQSATLSVRELTALSRDASDLLPDQSVSAETIALITSRGPDTRRLALDQALVDTFAALNDRWDILTARYLSSDVVIAEADPVLRLTAYWREFYLTFKAVAEIFLGKDKPSDDARHSLNPYACLYERSSSDHLMKLLCCDASAHLAACFEPFARVIAFSATLRPFEFYAKLSGLDLGSLGTASFASPFPVANRKVLVIPQVSTKLRDRRQNLDKIAAAIVKLSAARPGHYMALFPSFQFMNDVAERLDAPGFVVVRQTPGMSHAQTKHIVDALRAGPSPLLVLGVQGGSLSEGIDFPGEQLIGVVIVGPALPTCDEAREVLRAYYERAYGQRLGYDYAYTYPAMAKVVQAAGRVIRTQHDRGLIVLMDARFVEPRYSSLLPQGWFKDSVRELVSQRILGDIQAFWQGGDVLGSEDVTSS